jgi:A/G-specific adenine glycosylase
VSGVFASRILAWHARHGRHDLPWQRDPSAYRVWVSEVMLQQTQVTAVMPYYERFVARFPDLRALAAAPLDEVLHLWSGLGYYARARNLHAAAGRVCREHDGELPGDHALLCALPGIGRSTAGAILALSAGRRYAILDGNAKRVLARHAGVEGWPGDPDVARVLWALAEQQTPHADVAAYTQGMMDLGATVCTRGRPACERCPVSADCRAHALGRERELPAPRPRKALPVRSTRMLIAVTEEGAVLLEQRPPSGVWGGLWSFPELGEREGAEEWLHRRLGCGVRSLQPWPSLRHTFTHFHLDIQPLLARVAAAPSAVMEGSRLVWYNEEAPAMLGLAAPVRTLISRLGVERR